MRNLVRPRHHQALSSALPANKPMVVIGRLRRRDRIGWRWSFGGEARPAADRGMQLTSPHIPKLIFFERQNRLAGDIDLSVAVQLMGTPLDGASV